MRPATFIPRQRVLHAIACVALLVSFAIPSFAAGPQQVPYAAGQVPAALAAAPASAPQPVGPKREGTTRIGVVIPTVQLQQPVDSQTVAAQVLAIVVSYLQAPTLEIVPLSARVPAAAALEAQGLECDDLLVINVTGTSGNPKAGMFGFAKHLPLGMVPGLGALSNTAGAIAVQAATVAASAAANIAASTQPKDEVTFEYHLSSVKSGVAVATAKRSLKAKNAGEDLISPLVSAMANAVVPELIKTR